MFHSIKSSRIDDHLDFTLQCIVSSLSPWLMQMANSSPFQNSLFTTHTPPTLYRWTCTMESMRTMALSFYMLWEKGGAISIGWDKGRGDSIVDNNCQWAHVIRGTSCVSFFLACLSFEYQKENQGGKKAIEYRMKEKMGNPPILMCTHY